jgi:serine/threonine protein kinase
MSEPSPPPLLRDLPEQFGPYRIHQRLGAGGMAVVYLAQDTRLDRPVALKVPHFPPGCGPELRQRFAREARLAARLHHPHICPVYEVGQIDGVDYLAMAFIPGKPLKDLIAPDKPLPQRQVAALVRTLALALHEAHLQGIIHRDLKPSNVLINPRGEPAITDFGLAYQQQSRDTRLTPSGEILGTPAYMAPEQVSGDIKMQGPRCDVYSLGVVLYEMLTGQVPFVGPMMNVLVRVLTEEPASPRTLRGRRRCSPGGDLSAGDDQESRGPLRLDGGGGDRPGGLARPGGTGHTPAPARYQSVQRSTSG